MSRYIVMTSLASAPRGKRSTYRNVALCLVEDGVWPKMIRKDAKGMIRIVEHYGPHYVGNTKNCAYYRVLLEAEARCIELSKERAS